MFTDRRMDGRMDGQTMDGRQAHRYIPPGIQMKEMTDNK